MDDEPTDGANRQDLDALEAACRLGLSTDGCSGDTSAAFENFALAARTRIHLLEAEVARLTTGAASTEPEEFVDIDRLMREAYGRNAPRRIAAKQQIHELGIRVVGPLVSFLRRERVRRRKRDTIVSVLAGILMAVAWIVTMEQPDTRPSGGEILAVMAPFVVALGIILQPTQMQRRAARLLAQFETPRAIGPLAEAILLGDPDIIAIAKSCLMRILPQVRTIDRALVDADGVRRLVRLLDSDDDELVIATIGGLGFVGDESALVKVESLAESAPNGRVRIAASRCLASLLRASAGGADRLLRPSAAPEEPGGILLRPAAEAAGDRALLLRPGEPAE